MRSVNWSMIPGKVSGLSKHEIGLNDLLDSPWSTDLIAKVQYNNQLLDVNMSVLIDPLGRYGEALLSANRFDELKDNLQKYYQLKGRPRIFAYFLDINDEQIHIKNTVFEGDMGNPKKKKVDPNDLISEVNRSFEYDQVFIGFDTQHLELQFLNTSLRKAVKPGDFVDFGLFVSINGQIKVAPGVHQLRCTNGATEEMKFWDGKAFDDTYIKRAAGLADWIATQSNKPVHDLREISVRFSNFPPSFLEKFCKGWGERIALNDLTWFDVLFDITQAVNKTLSSLRYTVISSPARLRKLESDSGCRCPTCSAKVESK